MQSGPRSFVIPVDFALMGVEDLTRVGCVLQPPERPLEPRSMLISPIHSRGPGILRPCMDGFLVWTTMEHGAQELKR